MAGLIIGKFLSHESLVLIPLVIESDWRFCVLFFVLLTKAEEKGELRRRKMMASVSVMIWGGWWSGDAGKFGYF